MCLLCAPAGASTPIAMVAATTATEPAWWRAAGAPKVAAVPAVAGPGRAAIATTTPTAVSRAAHRATRWAALVVAAGPAASIAARIAVSVAVIAVVAPVPPAPVVAIAGSARCLRAGSWAPEARARRRHGTWRHGGATAWAAAKPTIPATLAAPLTLTAVAIAVAAIVPATVVAAPCPLIAAAFPQRPNRAGAGPGPIPLAI
jgi:hypothetical protein